MRQVNNKRNKKPENTATEKDGGKYSRNLTHFANVFVCGSWDCLMGKEKLTTHFNFVESSSYKWI